jgi:hypothetical protein
MPRKYYEVETIVLAIFQILEGSCPESVTQLKRSRAATGTQAVKMQTPALLIIVFSSLAWWCTPVIPAWRLKQEDYGFEGSLCYMMIPHVRIKKNMYYLQLLYFLPNIATKQLRGIYSLNPA